MRFSDPLQVLYFWHAWHVLGGPPLRQKEGKGQAVLSIVPFRKTHAVRTAVLIYQEVNNAIANLPKKQREIIFSFFREGRLNWHRWTHKSQWDETLGSFWALLPQELIAAA